jgi:hypothetical protein
MKASKILLAAPFVLLTGSAFAQAVIVQQPPPQTVYVQPPATAVIPQSTGSSTTTETKVDPNGTTVQKQQTVVDNGLGTITTHETKKVTTP